ncbi:MAG: glycosyltransferase [Ignavibacteriaceae bacterium]|nr:glycosyltransferase [Ignavibacteriaceae bacterium]
MDLSIIIVNYNVKEFLQNLLDSIYRASGDISAEIIIVDNASDDGSVEMVKEKYPGVILIENQENTGFAKANNLGLKIAKGKYLLLLNPDTLVSEDTFTKMFSFFDKYPDAGLATCKMIGSDGNLQLACRRSFPDLWTSFTKVTGLSTLFPKSRLFARYNLTYLDENKTYEVDAISGAFMMMKREVYEKIGGLDEEFFMYGEDLDWCFRVQKAGWKVYYYHETQIIHYKGESTKRSSLNETRVFYEAMHIFVKKYFSYSLPIISLIRLAIFLREMVAFLGKRKFILISAGFDLIFFNLTLYLAAVIHSNTSPTWRWFPDYGIPAVFTVPVAIHMIISMLTGAYTKEKISVLRTLGAVIVGFFTVSSLTFFFKDYAFSRGVLLISYFMLLFVLSGWRIIIKIVFRLGDYTGGLKARRTVIIGTDEHTAGMAKKLAAKPELKFNVIGLISLTRKDVGSEVAGFTVVGAIDNLVKVIREKRINTVIFTSGEISYNKMMTVVSSCQNENVEFQIAGNRLDYLIGKSAVSSLDNIPLFEVNYNISTLQNRVIKSLFDFVLGLVILALLYPFSFVFSIFSRNKSDFVKFVLGVPKVLSGKMSFVGPAKAGHNDRLYLGKQGLTGYWYTETEQEEGFDIYYARNQNIWLDIEILGKTFNKFISKK